MIEISPLNEPLPSAPNEPNEPQGDKALWDQFYKNFVNQTAQTCIRQTQEHTERIKKAMRRIR